MADLVVYALLLGLLIVTAAVLFTNPAPLLARLRAVWSATHVDLLGLPSGRPLQERFDYPDGREGAYAIDAEMRVWLGIVAGLADVAGEAAQIGAEHRQSGAAR
ncbi:hypothetical protein [Micromonospora sp. NPDC005174]|uniref:hypothetical protein n=1 Tax=Micromonospora sp. NPDC005174 TaxID=3157018 RepID=UPI0033B570F1